MKCVFFLVSCVLASASAGHTGHGATSYAYQSHPAASHHAVAYNTPVVHGGYYGPEVRLVDPVAIAAGAPLPVGDTHEVAVAKAAHFQVHAIARGQPHGYSHVAPVAHGYGYADSVSHGFAHAAPIAHGYAASVSHGYAHAALVVHGYTHGGHYGSEARLVDPVAIAAGAPLPVGDTHEVAAAKAAHFQAHAIARSRLHSSPQSNGYSHAHVAPVAHGYAHSYDHAAPIAHGYSHGGHYVSEARLVDPVAISAGAPLPGGDTYEVAAAKAAHFQAHAAVRNGHHVSYHG